MFILNIEHGGEGGLLRDEVLDLCQTNRSWIPQCSSKVSDLCIWSLDTVFV